MDAEIAKGLNPYCIGCTSLSLRGTNCRIIGIGLNPYCIGCTSLSRGVSGLSKRSRGLNPYCIGCTSLSSKEFGSIPSLIVLILIVLDVLL